MRKEIYEISVLGVAAGLYAVIAVMGLADAKGKSNAPSSSPVLVSTSEPLAFYSSKGNP